MLCLDSAVIMGIAVSLMYLQDVLPTRQGMGRGIPADHSQRFVTHQCTSASRCHFAFAPIMPRLGLGMGVARLGITSAQPSEHSVFAGCRRREARLLSLREELYEPENEGTEGGDLASDVLGEGKNLVYEKEYTEMRHVPTEYGRDVDPMLNLDTNKKSATGRFGSREGPTTIGWSSRRNLRDMKKQQEHLSASLEEIARISANQNLSEVERVKLIRAAMPPMLSPEETEPGMYGETRVAQSFGHLNELLFLDSVGLGSKKCGVDAAELSLFPWSREVLLASIGSF